MKHSTFKYAPFTPGHQYMQDVVRVRGRDNGWRIGGIPAGILLYPGVGVIMRELRWLGQPGNEWMNEMNEIPHAHAARLGRRIHKILLHVRIRNLKNPLEREKQIRIS